MDFGFVGSNPHIGVLTASGGTLSREGDPYNEKGDKYGQRGEERETALFVCRILDC